MFLRGAPPVAGLVPSGLAWVVLVAAAEAVVVTFTRVGFWAPHGLSRRQADWQPESPLAHLLTHWLLVSVQT